MRNRGLTGSGYHRPEPAAPHKTSSRPTGEESEATMTRVIIVAFTLFLLPLYMAPALAGSVGSIAAGAQSPVRLKSDGLYLKAGQCQQRAGPYATQNRAWRWWRQARGQGYAVSNGVVPCYDQYGSRGYCFFVYYAC